MKFDNERRSMIIIPDIHGRTFWKKAIEGHEEKKIVFLGDYTDPYPNECIGFWEGMKSLQEVIAFKKEHSDNVTLLLGNHDLSYVSNHLPRCRHDFVNHERIKNLICDNLNLFDIAHEEMVGNRRVLFSHAGILPGWLKKNENMLGQISCGNEANSLNALFHEGDIYEALGNVSGYRGGRQTTGSCVWADIEEFIDTLPHHLPGCYQVFGHSQIPEPMITDWFACLDCQTAFLLNDSLRFSPIQVSR